MNCLICFLMIGASARDYEHEARAALALAAAMRPQEPRKVVIPSKSTVYQPFVIRAVPVSCPGGT